MGGGHMCGEERQQLHWDRPHLLQRVTVAWGLLLPRQDQKQQQPPQVVRPRCLPAHAGWCACRCSSV
jgi:hypothetical protein